jgi:CcmD family protein
MTPDTFPSLFWSYTAVWLLLGVYIVSLGIRLRKVENKLSKGSKRCCGQDSEVA